MTLIHSYNFKRNCVLIFLLSLACKSTNGKCEVFQGSPATNHMCDAFVDDFISIFSLVTQPLIDSNLASQLAPILLYQPLAPRRCVDAFLQLSCESAFMRCNNVTYGENEIALVPSPPCKSQCRQVQTYCAALFSQGGGAQTLDCDQLDQSFQNPGAEQWPEEGWNVTYNGMTVYSPCNTGLKRHEVVFVDSCPAPLLLIPHPTDDEAPCTVGCLIPMFTKSEWKTLATWVFSSAVVSVITSGFVFISFVLNPEKRKFPHRIITFHEASVFLFTLGFCFGGYNDYEAQLCFDPVTPATQYNSPRCALQGFLNLAFGLATVFWWSILSFNVWLRIQFWKQKFDERRLEIIYHAVGWGLPAIIVIINFSAGTVGYASGNVGCLITDAYDDWFQYGTFFIPIAVAVVFTWILLILVIVRLATTMESPKPWRPHIRLLFLIVWTMYVNVFLIEQRFEQGAKKDIYTASLTEWTTCKVMENLGAPNANLTCDTDYPPIRVNLPVYITDLVGGVGIGIFGLLAFGLGTSNFRFWRQFLTNLFFARWAESREILTVRYTICTVPETQLNERKAMMNHGRLSKKIRNSSAQ